jgi:hypothetical protein
MTVSMTDIPVLHSAEVVPFTHKSCSLSARGLYEPLNTSMVSWRGYTMGTLQSSTSLRKPVTVSVRRGRYRNTSSEKPSQHDQPENLPIPTTPHTAIAPFGVW